MKPANRLISPARGIALIAATYVYFLIFAQFAFLRLVEAHAAAPASVRIIMGMMAAGGLFTSISARLWFRGERLQGFLLGGFVGCAVGALLATGAPNFFSLCLVSAIIGICLAVLTVSLSAELRLLLSSSHCGLQIGLGTGIAYAICNIPAVFGGSPNHQSWLAIAVSIAGAVLVLTWSPQANSEWSMEALSIKPLLFYPLVAIFAALVWLDSAAFVIIQSTPALNQFGWGSSTLQWTNAGTHLALALLAGWWLDRGAMSQLLVGAFCALGVAAVLASAGGPMAHLTHWFYTAGVSVYSTALVFAPIRREVGGSSQAVVARAGMLYGVAGWAGSVLGIGMAQDLHRIPAWFIGLAGLVIVTQVMVYRHAEFRNGIGSGIAAILVGALGVFLCSADARRNDKPIAEQPPAAAQGREVYISEGCIHCHSQYVRPESHDEEWWGPAAISVNVLREQPPLIGNRRQGPDLQNIGNRRSAEWNRIHLLDPRALSPGSCMPSYRHLFRPGDSRGEALVAYLSTLGADTIGQRCAVRERWSMAPETKPISGERAQQLFQASCSACHGSGGAGDGKLAAQLAPRPPRDLTKAEWLFIPKSSKDTRRLLEIARVIKFGIPATSMPGHETLSDGELLGLARCVESLHPPTQSL